jgi:hypothetical protein
VSSSSQSIKSGNLEIQIRVAAGTSGPANSFVRYAALPLGEFHRRT